MRTQDKVIRRLSILAKETIDWEAVFREELPRVYNFFRYRFGDGPEAEDLTSATFEKAWTKRNQYQRDRAAFSTWLISIARNLAVDHYRKHRQTTSTEEIELISETPGLEKQIQAQQDFDRLGRLLAALPEREQELVALKYGAELNNRQIAALTGLTETNVGSILHRVVSKLRSQWEALDGR